MMKIVVFSIFLLLVNAQGPDPWEESYLYDSRPVRTLDSTDDSTDKIKHTSPHADVFYKKLLKMIVSRAYKYTDQNGNEIQGEVRFSMSKNEFDSLEHLSTLAVSLTSSEFRKVDSILSNRIYHPTFVQRMKSDIKNSILGTLVNYYRELIVVLGLGICVYKLRTFNWHTILTLRGLLIISIFTAIVWEYCIAYQEAEIRTYEDIQMSNRPQSYLSYLTSFFYSEESATIPKITVKHHWEYLHPYTIVSRLINRIIYNPIVDIFTIMNSFSSKATSNMWWPFRFTFQAISMLLCLVLMSYLLISFIFYVLFGITFNINFFGLNLNMLRRNNDNRTSSRGNEPENTPDVHANNKLLDMCASLVNILGNQLQTNQPAITQTPNDNNEAKTASENNVATSSSRCNCSNKSNVDNVAEESDNDYESFDEGKRAETNNKVLIIYRNLKDRRKIRPKRKNN